MRFLLYSLLLIRPIAFRFVGRSCRWPSFSRHFATKSPRDASKEFINNFQGTRVFVENIPPNTYWREFKDFFKNMGLKVVYVSISKDAAGNQKSYGIAQFETVADREKCIIQVKDYKLRGNTLTVREDRQERRGNKEKTLTPKIVGGALSTRFRPRSWRLAEGYSLADVTAWGFNVAAISELLDKREKQRALRNFEYADELRNELRRTHGVQCDDDSRTWKPLVNFKTKSYSESDSDLDEFLKEL